MSKRLYPTEKGWLHAKLTMSSKAIVNPEEIKAFCSGGEPNAYDFPVLEQHGAVVTVVYRSHKRKAKEEGNERP